MPGILLSVHEQQNETRNRIHEEGIVNFNRQMIVHAYAVN